MDASLEAYEAERTDFERVLRAIQAIRLASESQLASFDWLLETIRQVGLVPIPEYEQTYAGEEEFINASQQGLIQLPREFARYLLIAARERPATYLEIGCFNGATASLATAYLQRFNPALQATTIDLWPAFLFYSEVRELLPLHYEVGKTSFNFRDAHFDSVFIDGDHSFDWSWADYQNVGRRARLCAFHDIANAPYLDLPLGGVCGAWELLKQTDKESHFEEIVEHPSGRIMGIGIRRAV
ncbi:MAG: hypothetical protein JWL90_1417 [Chthoniobacteraceae bacterium]|nr:hypothetical protein [Chthoniobacteraceae bacterium]